MSNWGKAIRNNFGWGQGAENNSIGWGSIYKKSNSGETEINTNKQKYKEDDKFKDSKHEGKNSKN